MWKGYIFCQKVKGLDLKTSPIKLYTVRPFPLPIINDLRVIHLSLIPSKDPSNKWSGIRFVAFEFSAKFTGIKLDYKHAIMVGKDLYPIIPSNKTQCSRHLGNTRTLQLLFLGFTTLSCIKYDIIYI